MKIAVLADLHYIGGSQIKARILDSAIQEASRRHVDAIVCAGDMLGTGTLREAREIDSIFRKHSIKVAYTHGNAELRTPSESASAMAVLKGDPPPDGIVFLDSSRGWCDPREISRLVGRNLLAVTHVPPATWGGDSAIAWRRACQESVLSLTVAGHTHLDSEGEGLSVIRGLDPDKAIGGPPAIAFYENDASGWRKSGEYEVPAIRPEEWTEEFRVEFLDDLGFSTMSDPFGGLEFAIENNVRNIELRDSTWQPESFAELKGKVDEWRSGGGRCLSLHLPALSFENGQARGVERLRDDCATAVRLGCNRVTLHVPSIHISEYNGCRVLIRDSFAEGLAPLKGTGIKIGVENMHMTGADAGEFDRHFGYTPDECQTQIELLRTIDGLEIGFHCDIGHARNNAPFASRFPVSTWYERLGAELNGMHIHQVKMLPDGGFSNHKPLDSFFGELISLSSLIYARRNAIIPRVPLFLEIREGLGPECYKKLSAF